jgi:ribosomal protein S18 acetylase RimI-like enzyme
MAGGFFQNGKTVILGCLLVCHSSTTKRKFCVNSFSGTEPMPGTNIRHLEPADFDVVSPVVDEWWGGRPVRALLPRLFFEHFRPTSFALRDGNDLAGFLVGFRSQSSPSVGYVHFIGVRPDVRARGFGRMLYECFFSVVSGLACTDVHAITSPVNEASIRFHRRLGFGLVPGNGEVNGHPVHLDHGGPGQHRVLFSKPLA